RTKNTNKIKPTLKFEKIIDDLVKAGNSKMDNILKDAVTDITDEVGGIIDGIFDVLEDGNGNDDGGGNDNGDGGGGSDKMYIPVDITDNGINFCTPPNQPDMDYGGYRQGRRHWAYDIGTLGNANVSCYAVRDGEVLSVNADNLGTVVIKHSSDKYYSQYMHLKLGAFTV